MDVLVALGTTMAWALSVAVTLLGLEHEHVYFEASAAVITLVLMGAARKRAPRPAPLLQSRRWCACSRRPHASNARGLIDGRPIRCCPATSSSCGRASLPVDGVVSTAPPAWMNEAMLTGESMPVGKAAGDTVFAATQNELGQLRCRATGVGEHTLLAGIIRLVAEAQGSKAPVQRLADQVSAIFYCRASARSPCSPSPAGCWLAPAPRRR